MKTYQVYGIGNALVDIEYQVPETILTALGIEKHVMTLIDEARIHTISQHLKKAAFVPFKKASGGSAANTMITLALFGHPVFYSCKVANDLFGDFYLHDLLAAKVATNLSEQTRTNEGKTGQCILLVTPDTHRSMNTFLGITAQFSKQEIVPDALKQSAYLYMEGYLVASPSGFEAMQYAQAIALKNRIKTALTLSDVNMVRHFKQNLEILLTPGVDILFANEAEALLFAETDSIEKAAHILKQYAKQVVITRSEKGAYLQDEKETLALPATKTAVLDTVGAGDAFAGAYLHAVTQGQSLKQAGILANFAASKVISQFGPRLKLQHMADIKNHFQVTA